MSLQPSMPGPLLVTVGGNAERAARAGEAFRRLFPHGAVESVANVAAAEQLVSDSADSLLALVAADDVEVAAAAAALDSFELPRWAVVVAGTRGDERVIAVPPEDWDAGRLASWFSIALSQHRLRRENARFRGDLLTLGTRFVHDLRSPLGGVTTTAEVLREMLAEDAPQHVTLLDPLLDSTEGVAKLLRQMGAITKASASARPKERFNMHEPFWAAMQRVQSEASALGASIRQPAAWPLVEGDAGWVETMWHMLLANALRHSGSAPRVEAGWTRDAGENRFWVMDQGGVPPEKQAMLFRPFHLLHHTNAPRGFGLPLVQRLAELQGGKSGYEPPPEGGSCFFFTLPTVENPG